MRDLTDLDRYRITDPRALGFSRGWAGDETCGAFRVSSPVDRAEMVVVASSEGGWDHVSVSRKNRCPNCQEMEHVALLFFRDDEVATQLHAPPSDHVNVNPVCLHWWRPQEAQIPRPPRIFV